VDTYSQKEADINQIAEWTAHKLIISPKRP
jgi:hypothetical protein